VNRRDDHLAELKDRLSHDSLERITLGLAETFGYAPYDLKIVHDDLVAKGYEAIPHLSDGSYDAAMQSRKAS
jgi:hypothetical protein